ncbi:hypothetical protein EZS27_030252, partial [termite gut metagenome]
MLKKIESTDLNLYLCCILMILHMFQDKYVFAQLTVFLDGNHF